jgi:hypothetical protein
LRQNQTKKTKRKKKNPTTPPPKKQTNKKNPDNQKTRSESEWCLGPKDSCFNEAGRYCFFLRCGLSYLPFFMLSIALPIVTCPLSCVWLLRNRVFIFV